SAKFRRTCAGQIAAAVDRPRSVRAPTVTFPKTHPCYCRPRVATFHRFVTLPTFIRNQWVLRCASNTSPTMKRTTLKLAAIAISVASVLCSINSQGQSADALLDKLVEKGILTTKEANDLKREADQNFTKAYQAKSGMSDWVTSLKLSGDFRGR